MQWSVLQPASAPTSQPTSRPTIAATVASLVAELSDSRFAVREAAQKKLVALGPAATPHLVPFFEHADPEAFSRLAQIVGKPHDPRLRVDVAVALVGSTDPDWMERGVHMLFDDPRAVCDRFVERTAGVQGVQRLVFEPVAERLRWSKRRWELFETRYQRLLREKPDAAARELKMNHETDLYEAEAAYWLAHDALLDYEDSLKEGRPTTDAADDSPIGPPP